MTTRTFPRSAPWLVTAAIAAPCVAAEITVKNDSITDAASATPCPCFIPEEEAAAWLTAPCDGKIVAVQIFWESQLGGAPGTTEMAIRIYDGSSYPMPGALLTNDGGASVEILGPVLSEGIFNEFRHLDQLQTIPLSVQVTSGQTFAVSLEFLNQNGGSPSVPSVSFDADGCQNGLNGAKTIPDGWADACGLGVGGDWGIRAIIDCSEADVPATSEWGWLVLSLLILGAGSAAIRRTRSAGSV